MRKIIAVALMLCMVCACFVGCDMAVVDSLISDIRGDLVGIGYTIDCFDNFGNLVTKASGDKINVQGNHVMEGENLKLSSVLTVNVDGHQIVSCGDTLVFYEDGIEPIHNFKVNEINSTAEDWTDATLFTGMVNSIKNLAGKPVIVVIKSQTGYPIYAFSGSDVYWEVPSDLPKMTCLNIDGHRVYIHRANYQIIDTALLED